MPILELPFGKGTDSDLDADFRSLLPTNYINVPAPEHPYIRSAPGIELLGAASGQDRGAQWNERLKLHLRVSGNQLVSVDASGAVTGLGEIPQSDQVSLTYSFNTQAIFNQGEMYLYDPDKGLRQVTDPDLGPVFDGVWIDGYYWMTDGEFIVITELNDESAVDPLKYGSSEYSPDPILAVGKTADNKGIAFNRYSIEYFTNQGTTGFPFVRIASRAVRAGLVGTHAKCEIAGTYALIGSAKEETPSIYMLGTGSLQKIATREIDEIIKTYSETELSKSVLEARVEDAHKFVICRLPRHTLMYDLSTNQWCILKSDALGDTPWRCRNGVYDPRSGKWIYGDELGGNLGVLTEKTPTQYGEVAEGIFYTPIMFAERISINEMKVKHLPGRGPVGDLPRAFFSVSVDGLTWGQEYAFMMGGRADYQRQFIIRRVGYIDSQVSFRVRIANNTPTAFTKMTVDYS